MTGTTLLERIHEMLSVTGKSARRASIEAGMGPDVIRDIERDPGKSVTLKTIQNLARALDCEPAWLAFGSRSTGSSIARVPIISWVSAGSFEGVNDVWPEDPDYPTMEAVDLPPGDWFALTVEGDSMDRISPPGSIILVNRRDKKLIPNGCYVIANELGEATYKRYRPSPDRFEPVSVNSTHDPIFPDGAITVIGRVRRSILEM